MKAYKRIPGDVSHYVRNEKVNMFYRLIMMVSL